MILTGKGFGVAGCALIGLAAILTLAWQPVPRFLAVPLVVGVGLVMVGLLLVVLGGGELGEPPAFFP